MFTNKIKPFLYLGGFYLIVSFILRLVLINHPITTTDFNFSEILKIIGIGVVNDILVFTVASCILALYFLFLSNSKYSKPTGYFIFGLLVTFLLYTLYYPNNIFKQYGGSVPEIAAAFIGLKTLLFGLLLFFPKQRFLFRNSLYFITLLIYVLVIVYNTVSEYFFWNEFGVRYNFIAVDYLIYTNEVIGNVIESYPVIPLFTAIILVSIAVTIYIYKKTKDTLVELPTFGQKVILLVSYSIMVACALWLIPITGTSKTNNIFVSELQANGLPKFYDAFNNKELDFISFYSTLDQKEAEQRFLSDNNRSSLLEFIKTDSAEIKKNVVLISIESLSADFMAHYGNEKNITPFLDSLANESLMFTNLYATGNRTVRGLEALTLALPPAPGESVVKRKDNKNKFTTGSIFKSKGYQVKYLYGGYSYFDNMKDFFGGNGYDIVDRDNFKPEEVSFANVWGVCDEDMAKKAIEVMNAEHKTGKPFFNHWMTVSNHRPFTYPEGKIDIPGNAKSRDGGVKYTDYSVRKFFELAKKQPWYSNTVFVIVADHCASSAGKTELPLEKYRIPGMIFAPGFVQPSKFSTLMSQIDVMPTLFGLLNFSYESKLLGQNVFSPNYQPRAYVATYQDLGLIKDNKLTVISPTRKAKQYDLTLEESALPAEFKYLYKETPVKTINQNLVNDAVAAYQSTTNWLKKKQLDR